MTEDELYKAMYPDGETNVVPTDMNYVPEYFEMPVDYIPTEQDIAGTYSDYDQKANESISKVIISQTPDVTISTVQDVYDNENHGLYEIIDKEGVRIVYKEDIDSENEIVKATIEEYEKEHPSHEYETRVNLVTDEGKNTGKLLDGNRVAVSISVVDKTEEERLGLKGVDKIVATNPTPKSSFRDEIAAYKDISLIAEKRLEVEIPTNKLKDENYVKDGQVIKLPYKSYEIASNEANEIKQDLIKSKTEYFQNNVDLKSLVKTAESTGFLTQEDKNSINRNEIKSPQMADMVKANIAISRLFSMPLVLDIAKNSFIANGDEQRYKVIQERTGNIENLINNIDFGKPLKDITNVISDMSKISNYIKDGLSKHENLSSTGISYNDEKGSVVITKEKLNEIDQSKIPFILSSSIPPYTVDNGRLVKFDIEKPIYNGDNIEMLKNSAITLSSVEKASLGDHSREEIDKGRNNINAQISNDETTNTTNDEPKQQNKQVEEGIGKQETKQPVSKNVSNDSSDKRNESKERHERRVEKEDDTYYNPETGQYESRGDTKATPGKLLLAAGFVAMIPLGMAFGPLAAAIMIPSLLGAGVVGSAVKMFKERKEEKADKEEDVQTKVEQKTETPKEKGPSLIERISDKIHTFGEKMENVREGKFQERVDNEGIKTGILNEHYEKRIEKDKEANQHPVIEKISTGLHKMTAGNVLGNIFDKITAPITKTSTDNVDSYLSNSNIRAKDLLKYSIGLKGESIGSAFEKIKALAGNIGKDVGSVKTDIGKNNISTKKEDYEKLGIGGFLKSAFAIIGRISIGTTIAESKIDFNEKIDKREYTDSGKLINIEKDLSNNKSEMTSAENERKDLIEKGENTEKVDSKLSDIYKERADILNKVLKSSIPEVTKASFIIEKQELDNKRKELGNERIEQVGKELYNSPNGESVIKANNVLNEIKATEKEMRMDQGTIKAIFSSSIELIKESPNGESKEIMIKNLKDYIGSSLLSYDSNIAITKKDIFKDPDNKQLKDELKEIEKDKVDFLKNIIAESKELNLSEDKIKEYEQEIEKTEKEIEDRFGKNIENDNSDDVTNSPKTQEDSVDKPVNEDDEGEDPQSKVDEEPSEKQEKETTNDKEYKKGDPRVVDGDEQEIIEKRENENSEEKVEEGIKKQEEKEGITAEEATDEKDGAFATGIKVDADEQPDTDKTSIVQEKTNDGVESSVASIESQDSEQPDEVPHKNPDEDLTTTESQSSDETVSEIAIELPNIKNPEEIKEFAEKIENNEYNPNDVSQAIVEEYKNSDNPKSDLIEFANALKEEGVLASNIQEVIDKAMDKMELPKADRDEITAQIEPQNNNNDIEKTADEAFSACSDTLSNVVEFITDKFEDGIHDLVDIGMSILGLEDRVETEIHDDLGKLTETIDPAFLQSGADAEKDNVSLGVETQPQEVEKVADYSNPNATYENQYDQVVVPETPSVQQEQSATDIKPDTGIVNDENNIPVDTSSKDF